MQAAPLIVLIHCHEMTEIFKIFYMCRGQSSGKFIMENSMQLCIVNLNHFIIKKLAPVIARLCKL